MNVLSDAVFSIEFQGTRTRLALPGVFAALVRDEVDCFPGLRAHQVPAWHMFLAQLGAIAMYRNGIAEPPRDEAEWYRIIRSLTAEEFPDDEPWCLVVADEAKPAFLQPPVPAGTKFTKDCETPDALDPLRIAKSHDLKQAVSFNAPIDCWIYSLVNLQTCDGALTNNPRSLQLGIARLKDGDRARPFFGLAPIAHALCEPRWGAHICHDLRAMIANRTSSAGEDCTEVDDCSKPALLWTLEWDHETMLLHQVDRWFVEICRVIRLSIGPFGMIAQRAGSPSRRLDSSASLGVTGDPWTPVELAPKKGPPVPFSVNKRGFHYKKISDVLFREGGFSIPACLDPKYAKTTALYAFVARSIVRTQGGTEGYVERVIPIGTTGSAKVLSRRKQLDAVAKNAIGEVDQLVVVLETAIGVFSRNGTYLHQLPENGTRLAKKKQREVAGRFVQQLTAEADRLFFPALWARLEAEDKGTAAAVAARAAFIRDLDRAALRLLDEAIGDLPCASLQRPRAAARARARYFSGRRKAFDDIDFHTIPTAEEFSHAGT